ncbi:MAG: SHOCT domain-containing protein [Candidatus Saccharimonadales bacterium]
MGFVFMLLMLAIVIIGVILIVRYIFHHSVGVGGNREDTALDILGKRYASGEIDKDEFEEKRKVLSK